MKTICFVTRRYSGSGFWNKNQEFYNQVYDWVLNLKTKHTSAVFVIGSDRDHFEENRLGKFYYIKDKERKFVFSYSSRFFTKCASIIKSENATIVHGHGLQDVFSFVQILGKLDDNTKLFVQDHASRYQSKYKLYKPWFNKVDGVFFHSPGQEQEWVNNKIIPKDKVHYAPEGVVKIKQANSPKRIGQTINLLWVGDLNENKQPLMVVAALNAWINEGLDIKLKMVFRNAPILTQLNDLVRSHGIEKRIELIGPLQHDKLLSLYSSMNYFISASQKEGSGYAAMEAMAAGLIPILNDIPSFRDFTDNGKIGLLFDDINGLINGFMELIKRDYYGESKKVLDRFGNCYSAKAKAEKHMLAYFGDQITKVEYDKTTTTPD